MKMEGLEYSNKFELNPKEMQNLLKQEHLLSKENRRKSMIQEKLFQKRHLQSQSKQRTLLQFFAPEEPKDIQMKENVQMVEENKEEEIRGKRYPNLNQHFKKRTKKSRKRCWYCFSFSHLKRYCPNIHCFYCGNYGHIKKDCHKKKINYLYSILKEMAVKEEKRKNKKEKKKEKREEKKQQIKIMMNRALYMNSEVKKTEKGDKMMIRWKNMEIGEFIGQGLPQVTIEKIKQHQFNPKLFNVLLKKNSPINSLTLYNGFSFWCACGEIDFDRTNFLIHVRRKHENIVPMHSQLNRPFWFDWVLYKTDTLEQDFCYTLSDLS